MFQYCVEMDDAVRCGEVVVVDIMVTKGLCMDEKAREMNEG